MMTQGSAELPTQRGQLGFRGRGQRLPSPPEGKEAAAPLRVSVVVVSALKVMQKCVEEVEGGSGVCILLPAHQHDVVHLLGAQLGLLHAVAILDALKGLFAGLV